MKLERSKPEDAEECVRWMLANLFLNDCSPRTLKGSIFYKIDGVLHLPIKPVIILESLAPNPAVTGKKRLLAIRRAMDDLVAMYPGTELIFMTRGNTKLDEAARYYGFKEEPYRVYRLIGGRQGRTKAEPAKARVAETRLQDHAGTDRGPKAGTTGNVSYMQLPAGQRQSEEPAGCGSHQGDDHRSGHRPQPLQFGDRTRA